METLMDSSFSMPLFTCGYCKRTSCHMVCIMVWFNNKMSCPHCSKTLHYSHVRPEPVHENTRSETNQLARSPQTTSDVSNTSHSLVYIDNYPTLPFSDTTVPIADVRLIPSHITLQEARKIRVRLKVVSATFAVFALVSVLSHWMILTRIDFEC